MAIKLAKQVDTNVPGVVRAVVAHRADNLEAQTYAKISNAKKTKQASTIMHRIHNNG